MRKKLSSELKECCDKYDNPFLFIAAFKSKNDMDSYCEFLQKYEKSLHRAYGTLLAKEYLLYVILDKKCNFETINKFTDYYKNEFSSDNCSIANINDVTDAIKSISILKESSDNDCDEECEDEDNDDEDKKDKFLSELRDKLDSVYTKLNIEINKAINKK